MIGNIKNLDYDRESLSVCFVWLFVIISGEGPSYKYLVA